MTGVSIALKKLDDVYEIYDVTDQYYSIVKIRTSGTEQLSKIIDKISTIQGVSGAETAIVLQTMKEEHGLKL